MRWRRRRSLPRPCLAQGCPSLPPMAVAQGESALFVPPDARSRPCPRTARLFVGDFSSGCRALRRWPILRRPDEPFAHSSLVRHLTSTGHPPSSPPILDCPVEVFCCGRGRPIRPSRSKDAAGRLGTRGAIVDHFDGAPIDTGRTGEPEAPWARSGKIMVHDSQTLSLASSPRRAFWIWWMPECARL